MTDSSYFLRKYIKDIIFSSIASGARALQGFAFLIIVSKTLGAENYGIWTQIITTVALLMPIALLQLGLPMSRFLAIENDKKKISAIYFAVIIIITGVSLVFSLLLFAFAEPFASAFLKGANAADFIRLSAFLVLLTSLDQIIIQYFWAFRQNISYAIFSTVQLMAEVIMVWFLINSDLGLCGAISALIVIRVLAFIAGFLYIKRQLIFTKPDFAILRTYLKFGLPLFPYTFCSWIINYGSRYMIGFFLGATEVGIFAAAYSLGSIINLFYSPVVGITLPTVSYLHANNKIEEIKSITRYIIKLFLGISIPATLMLIVLAKPLLSMMTTAEFTQVYFIVPVIALSYIFYCSGEIFANLLLLYEGARPLSMIFSLSTLINVAVNIALIPWMGIQGAAVSLLITFIFQMVFLIYRTRKSIKINPSYMPIAKYTLSSVLISGFIWWQNPEGTLNVIITVLSALIIYILLLILLREIDPRKILYIKTLFK